MDVVAMSNVEREVDTEPPGKKVPASKEGKGKEEGERKNNCKREKEKEADDAKSVLMMR